MASKKSGNEAGKVAAVAALAVAGVAGAYFLFGKNAPKRRKQVKSWVLKAKAEVLEKLEKAKEVSEDQYHAIVDAVGAKYANLKDTTPEEIVELGKELRTHWKSIKKDLTPKKAVKKSIKK